MATPATPTTHLSSNPAIASNSGWTAPSGSLISSGVNTPTSASYLMPTSPAKHLRGFGRSTSESKPKISKTTGQKPACLVNASITYCSNEQIYAFGGFDQFTDEVYNHVLRLNLKTLNWELVDNYGDIPGVRMGHSASLYDGDKLLVYGGENEHREYLSDVVILNLTDHHWHQPEIHGPRPKGRARHAAVVYEDKLFIIGGLTGENNYILDDICYLDLKTWRWSRTWSFVQRFDHTAWIWGGRLWILGGLGLDMERSTEIWWLDLKGVPSLGLDSRSSGARGLLSGRAPSSRQDPFLSHSRVDRTEPYTANSTSVHIRSTRRDNKPTAPGAISSLKFWSGPYVPAQSSGTHFHVCSSGALLDFVTPAGTLRHDECNLSSLELDSLRWQKIVPGKELFQPGYKWHYCTINEDGTKVWLLGSIADDGSPNQELHLSEVLAVDLRHFGLLGNEMFASEQTRIIASETPATPSSGLGADLVKMFDQPPEDDSMTDFIITANADIDEDDSTPEPDAYQGTRFSTNSTGSQIFVSETSATSPSIHVHKMILRARWPHFKRLYASKMLEFQTSRLHVPEPYSVVRAFLYYLYTDSISYHPVFCRNLTDVAGMLVMANLYDMPKLRLICVSRLSREIDVEHAAVIFERASRTGEEWLKNRAGEFCVANSWAVARTDGFKTLPRQSLLELFEFFATQGRGGMSGFGGGASGGGVGGPPDDLDGDIWGSFMGSDLGGRRRHRASETEADTEADDDDNMDMY